jgi:hypothetical protein
LRLAAGLGYGPAAAANGANNSCSEWQKFARAIDVDSGAPRDFRADHNLLAVLA